MGATKQQLETQLSELNKAWNAEKLTIVKNIDIGLEPVQDYTEFGGRVTQYFIADDIYDVSAIRAVHNIAQTSADGAALQGPGRRRRALGHLRKALLQQRAHEARSRGRAPGQLFGCAQLLRQGAGD